MGEGVVVLEEPDLMANRNELKKITEVVAKSKAGVTEMEEDKKDADKKVSKEIKEDVMENTKVGEDRNKVEDEVYDRIEEGMAEEPEEDKKNADKKVSKVVKEDIMEITKLGKDGNKFEDEVYDTKEEGTAEEPEELTKKNRSRKRPRKNSSRMEKGEKRNDAGGKEEPRTPKGKKAEKTNTPETKDKELKVSASSTIERPVRERKSVKRLISSIDKESAKEFKIEKGRGIALKDIPNVASKLSRRKADDTLKLLHTILFARRAKAGQVKKNISKFSGFVWHDNEEKQMIKVKEKLDKYVKEKLTEICDVLDIPAFKANTRKEDIIAKLLEFLVAPHATTTELLAEEQSNKGKKRKRVSKSASESSTPTKGSAKSRKGTNGVSRKRSGKKSLRESGKEQKESHEDENFNGFPKRSEKELSRHGKSQSEEKQSKPEVEPLEDKGKQRPAIEMCPGEKESPASNKKLKVPKKPSPLPGKQPRKLSSSLSKNDNETSKKKYSSKRKDSVNEKPQAPKKSAEKESAGKKVVKGKAKTKNDQSELDDDELRNAICEILREVDFNTATFLDIIKLVDKRFNMDLTPRKSVIKLMIQEELTKLAEESDTDIDKEENPSDQGVKA